MFKYAIISAALLISTAASADPLANIRTFTVNDLKAALADAQAQTPPDTRHGACWSALIPFAQSVQLPVPAGLGVAQLDQKIFDIQSQTAKGIFPDSVVQACALTVYDLRTDFLKLGAAVGLGTGLAIKLPVLP